MERLRDGTKLNSAKLLYPPVPDDFVPRWHLQARLDLIARRPLALVSAPAGYGKTTVLSAWLEKSELYRAWLSLDESDNDFALFLTYFLAAVRRTVPAPAFGAELEAILERGNPLSAQTFTGYLYKEFDALDRGIGLVLEDFHLIHNADILRLIGELMRHPHPALHLVLLSRHDPQLPLSEWRARNQMIEIRSADLRFSLEETTAFLNAIAGRPLDDEVVANLYAGTEGWAAGLRLAALSLTYAREDVENHPFEFSANNRHIVEFLAEHVFASLNEQQQTFLIQTSVLNRLSGPLCQAVIASPEEAVDGRAMLRELYRKNLFIMPLDAAQQWFRYHHLLGEYLRGRLVREYAPEEVTRLHVRAARWFAEAGYVEQAIRHMIVAGEMGEAVNLMAAVRHDLLNKEHFGRLSSLCNLFPEAVILASPDLMLSKAWIAHSMRFDITELASLVAEVDSLISNLDLEPERRQLLAAENDILAGVVLYYNVDPATSLAHCRRSLEVLPKSYYTLRSFAWIYGAGSLQMSGDLSGAHEMIRLSRREDLAAPGSLRARNALAGGYIHWMAANLAGVMEVGNYLPTLTATADQHITKAWGHYFLASGYYHQNKLVEARHHAESAFAARLQNRGFFAIYTGFILALIHQAAGNQEGVREIMAQTLAYAVDLQSPPLISAAQAFQVELDIRQGHLKQAAQWAKQAMSTMRLGAMPFFYAPPLTAPKALLMADDIENPELLADCLHRLRVHLETTHNVRFLIEVLALEAMFQDAQGDKAGAVATLEHSLNLAERSGFTRLYVDLGPRMKQLLARLRAHQPTSSYIPRVLAAFPGEKPAPNGTMVEPLTQRELQVLNLLAKRYSNKEIAQELFIASVTVKRHTVNIYQKLNVGNRREAVQAAQLLQLID